MDPDKIVREFSEAWERADVDAIVEAFTEDAVYHNILMAPLKGKEEIRNILSEASPETAMLVAQLGHMFPMGDPPNYEPSYEESIEAIAKRSGVDAIELMYDRMLERDGRELFLVPLLYYSGLIADPIRERMYHSRAALGLGD